MSTYYYMGCEDCDMRTKIIAVVRLSGQHIDNAEDFLKFLMKHHDCDLKFFSEYDDDRLDYSVDELESK